MSTFQKNKSPLISTREGEAGTRIHKVLAQSGYGSRREIEKAISEQKVKVNNEIATLGQPVLTSDKITYNGKIVKIGMTIKTLKERYGSYMCGTRKAMKKGSCSSTNYVITECNYFAMKNNYEVEIFAIKIPKETKTITRFGITREIEVSIARSLEEMITDKFIDTYGHKPILCVQKGNSTK